MIPFPALSHAFSIRLVHNLVVFLFVPPKLTRSVRQKTRYQREAEKFIVADHQVCGNRDERGETAAHHGRAVVTVPHFFVFLVRSRRKVTETRNCKAGDWEMERQQEERKQERDRGIINLRREEAKQSKAKQNSKAKQQRKDQIVQPRRDRDGKREKRKKVLVQGCRRTSVRMVSQNQSKTQQNALRSSPTRAKKDGDE